MTAQGGDLLAWLDRAISLREEQARALGGGRIEVKSYGPGVISLEGAIHLDGGAMHEDEIAFIAANDPESVLRRCAADRKLLKLHGGKMHSCPATDEADYLDEWTQFRHEDTCPVVQLIAEGYGWAEETSLADAQGQTPPTEGDRMT
ncbi:hypothetical protein GCM10010330_81170 [Streptomyces tendae]|uniref:DUF6221 family protein n=1 Tax=Streptomyces TaxID=1883 RepID=UPI00167B0E68|nr:MULTISPECIES: DUF6221 family protein [Streptomyces]GHB15701.1 hypothetical protein GCM10010330_81170 [Streptomyces tendae]